MDALNNKGAIIGKLERVDVPGTNPNKPLKRWDAWDLRGEDAGRHSSQNSAIVKLELNRQMDAAFGPNGA